MRDQDHIPVVMVADPTVPDRSAALLSTGEDPLPALRRGVEGLVALGATFIAVPSNAAHAFLDPIRQGCPALILDMINETAHRVRRVAPTARAVGLLATAATIQIGLYHAAMARQGLRVLTPSGQDQARFVTTAIASVKQGNIGPDTKALLGEAVRSLLDQGADAVVAGCTEIPLALDGTGIDVPFVDATQVLVDAVVAHWIAANCADSLSSPSNVALSNSDGFRRSS
jgi:aspartate racemase